jgi:nucleotide-binding universal stress UspA family protein
MYTFKNILVPVDGSEFSLNAAQIAASIAEKYQAQLTLLHVISHSLDKFSIHRGEENDFNNEINKIRQQGVDILKTAVKSLGDHDTNIEMILSWGDPAKVILEEVEDKGFDLIVIGSRGLGTIRGLFLGSVTERISRAVACPVLTVKKLG